MRGFRDGRFGLLTLGALLVACEIGPPSESYFPLDAGHYWHYSIQRTTMDGEVTQKYIIETLKPRPLNGARVNAKRTVDGNEFYYRQTPSGIVRVGRKRRHESEIEQNQPHSVVLPANLAVGSRWQRESHTSVLENTGPPWETLFRITEAVELSYVIETNLAHVSVPAGEFEQCLKVVATGRANTDVGNYIGHAEITVEVTDWYAPGVGLVRSERIETTDAKAIDRGTIVMELESYQ